MPTATRPRSWRKTRATVRRIAPAAQTTRAIPRQRSLTRSQLARAIEATERAVRELVLEHNTVFYSEQERNIADALARARELKTELRRLSETKGKRIRLTQPQKRELVENLLRFNEWQGKRNKH